MLTATVVGLRGAAIVLPLLLAGWALVGLGVGMSAPQVYAVAGHVGGGRVLAHVITIGYAAFLAGPTVIGFLVDHIGIHHTTAVPAALRAGIIALAAVMPSSDGDLAGQAAEPLTFSTTTPAMISAMPAAPSRVIFSP